ncbi:hypothetical protein H072_2970 [Dactylellina haptotyla CBS 200.50]|uniref:Rhodopsin domain-containing protein n=1 Tax=Dactylellina haptotyla (strain CBS 200.50) TaxID=1284197 RepID=S8C5R6_DACHA|nr:hypothetical protein H072_2970 [Dactylellina haptotyla CBS 200.50]
MSSAAETLSTGQTMKDLIQLAQLRNLSGPSVRFPKDWVPPALLDPNYVPPVRLRETHLASGTIFLVISGLLVSWKIVTTQGTRTTKLLFLEDWLLLMALTGQVTYIALTWVGQQYQVGWHVYDVKYRSVVELYKFTGIGNIILIWIYCTSRASLLISMRRMYSPIHTRIKFLIDFLAVAKFFTLVICIFAFVFAVPQHPEAPFDIGSALKNGANILESDIHLMATQAAFDTIILLCPFPLLWKLKNLPRRRFGQIMAFCGFGIITLLVGYARLGVIIHMKDIIWDDFTWYLPIVGITNNIEIFLVMITACLPTANLFFKWAYNKPRIPAATPRLTRRTIRKYRKKKNPDSTTDTVQTEDTYDGEWLKYEEVIPSENIRAEDLRIARIRTIDAPLPMESAVISKPDSIASNYDKETTLPIRSSIGNAKYLHHGEPSASSRKSIVSLRETDIGDEEEDNFYEMLIPSDAFFPFETGLRPRPSVRPSGEHHELQNV